MKYFNHLANFTNKLIVFILLISLTFSCDNSRDNFLPNVSGAAGELMIVIDKQYKDHEIGSALRKYLQADYPQLPQQEPLFDLTFMPTSAFNQYMQTHRSILACNINPNADSATIKITSDVWASPQIYMEINARTSSELLEMIHKYNQKITNYFTEGEKNRLIQNYRSYRDLIITDKIKKQFGYNIAIPKGYKLDVAKDSFMWISNETNHTSQGILLYHVPFNSNSDSLIKTVILKHDSVLKQNVPGSLPNSWMVTESEIPVSIDTVSISGLDFIEIRGLWRVENDYMGGPYILYAYMDKKNSQLQVLSGYVYAPRFEKRTYLQQVEAILLSYELKK